MFKIHKRKRKRYSIDERLNKQVTRDMRRRKTGVIIFLSCLFAGIVALIVYVLGHMMFIIQ